MIEFQAKRQDQSYGLILDDNIVIEIRKFKNCLRAKAFFHRRKMQHKNNGWEKCQMKVPMAPAIEKKPREREGRIIRVMGYPVRIGDRKEKINERRL